MTFKGLGNFDEGFFGFTPKDDNKIDNSDDSKGIEDTKNGKDTNNIEANIRALLERINKLGPGSESLSTPESNSQFFNDEFIDRLMLNFQVFEKGNVYNEKTYEIFERNICHLMSSLLLLSDKLKIKTKKDIKIFAAIVEYETIIIMSRIIIELTLRSISSATERGNHKDVSDHIHIIRDTLDKNSPMYDKALSSLLFMTNITLLQSSTIGSIFEQLNHQFSIYQDILGINMSDKNDGEEKNNGDGN